MKVKYFDLKNKKVFITGGGSGIGASIVEHFCEQECDVYFVDIEEKDPSDIGFGKINSILANTEKLTSEWLMNQRILGI